jgi:hypothetical protein
VKVATLQSVTDGRAVNSGRPARACSRMRLAAFDRVIDER